MFCIKVFFFFEKYPDEIFSCKEIFHEIFLFGLEAKIFLQRKIQIMVFCTKYNYTLYQFLYKQQVVSKQLLEGTKNSSQCLLRKFDSSVHKTNLTSMTSLLHKETITLSEKPSKNIQRRMNIVPVANKMADQAHSSITNVSILLSLSELRT